MNDSMILFGPDMLKEYEKNDVILKLLKEKATEMDGHFTSHGWLLDSLPKRMIYDYIYGDLLFGSTKRKRVLDVGGGYSSLTRVLLERHEYTLLDIMAHDDQELLRRFEKASSRPFWSEDDWYRFEPKIHYDLVIANDLFPNVDQRMEIFLEKYLPHCREMRISLTYYNVRRWYQVRRIDAEEIFHMMAWDGLQVKRVLEKFTPRIQEPRLALLLENPSSLYANHRQICLIQLKGGSE